MNQAARAKRLEPVDLKPKADTKCELFEAAGSVEGTLVTFLEPDAGVIVALCYAVAPARLKSGK